MRIDKVTFSGGVSGFYFDDQRAIKEGARRDGFAYKGEPATRGFTAIRQPGESISFILRLENGAIARGDAAAVQYSGAHGRSPLFIAEQHLPHLRNRLGPALEGLELNSFRDAIRQVDRLDEAETIHPAVRYGLSQAVLEAVALARNALKVEVICEEYDLPLVPEPLPIFGQSGDHRHEGADKMILKEADVLPHGLLNNVREKIGTRGEKLREYLTWLTGRIRELRLRDDYQPTLHIDVYGNLGSVFDRDTERIADYLGRLDDITGEFPLYVEGPVDMDEQDRHIELLGNIRRELQKRDISVKIVADEWCNSFDDVKKFVDARCCDMVQLKTPHLGSLHSLINAALYCRNSEVEYYQGGTCNETDISARCCVHVALATRPDRMLAKPGMGFDEGFMIVKNEMNRTLALLNGREEQDNG